MSLSVHRGSLATASNPAFGQRTFSPAFSSVDFGASFPVRLRRNSDCVPTPPNVAAMMIELLDIQPGMRILEPSAGTGNIADEVLKSGDVDLDVVELDEELRRNLRKKGHHVVGSDFMDFRIPGYDRIIMNPPFSKKDQDEAQCVLHVKHAYSLLAPGGRLAAIVPSWVFFTRGKGRKPKEFVSWLQNNTGGHAAYPLEPDTFDNDESSAQVRTSILLIHKPKTATANSSVHTATHLDLIA